MTGVARIIVAVVLFSGSTPLEAQESPETPASENSDPTMRFLPRFRGYLEAARLGIDDERFSWDGVFGGDVAILGYRRGEVSLQAEYEVIMGDELRGFDPNQGNYTLAVRASLRHRRFEFAGLFSHVSRHLSDRPKRDAVDWNRVGGEVIWAEAAGDLDVRAFASALGVIQRSFVDYVWTIDYGAALEYPVHPQVVAIGSGAVRLVGTDSAVAGRKTQAGAFVEGGLRFPGDAGTVDFVVAFERRVDADPLVRAPEHWVRVGFRLLTN